MYENDYESVLASQTDQVCGNGKKGNILKRLIIVPTTVNAGEVLIQDGDGTAISVFKGGTGGVADLSTIVIEIDAIAVNIGASTSGWKITTGADVTALAVGKFNG